MNRSLFIYLCFFCLGFLPQWARADTPLQITAENGQEIITISLTGAASAHVFTLEHPNRLVVDLPSLPKGSRVEMPGDYKGTIIKAVRLGRFNLNTSRLVFDLGARPTHLQTKIDGRTLQIALGAGNQAPAAAVQKPSPIPAPEKPAPVVLKKAPKKKEDTRPIIVIDAGHGGQDPGTIGPSGTQEKSITLEYARALRKALLATGHFHVLMTRDDDRFILLRQRVMIGRKDKADLFVSLHADSAPSDDAHGLSVYTLSEKASDAEAQALAERENKVDAVYGLDLSDQSKDVADILISLAQRDTNNRSATLAETLEHSLQAQGVKLLNNSHRFAGFAVLKAPDIPSALIETGFLSNPVEERMLLSKTYREHVAKGLAKGIDAYFQQKKGSM